MSSLSISDYSFKGMHKFSSYTLVKRSPTKVVNRLKFPLSGKFILRFQFSFLCSQLNCTKTLNVGYKKPEGAKL